MGSQVGVFAKRPLGAFSAAELDVLMLHSSMNRGKGATGITVSNAGWHSSVRGFDNPRVVFKSRKGYLRGYNAIGNTLYGTGHLKNVGDIPPVFGSNSGNNISISLEGRISNYDEIYERMDRKGTMWFTNNTHEELLIHLITQSRKQGIGPKIADALKKIKGNYSLVALVNNTGFLARDPKGTIPLHILTTNSKTLVANDPHCFSSVSQYLPKKVKVEEAEPGVLYCINGGNVKKEGFSNSRTEELCFHEIDYFYMPTNEKIAELKEALGAFLYEKHGHLSPYVAVVPNSGNHYGKGFFNASSLFGGGHFEVIAFIRSHYGGVRILDYSTAYDDELDYKAKFEVCKKSKKLPSIIIIDDMLRGGGTMKWIVKNAKEHVAEKVFVLTGSPEIIHNCTKRRDFRNKPSYIGFGRNEDDIARELGADGYHSVGFGDAVRIGKGLGINHRYCADCYKK